MKSLNYNYDIFQANVLLEVYVHFSVLLQSFFSKSAFSCVTMHLEQFLISWPL